MSRSGYTDDCEHLQLYRNAVDRGIKGKRGQAFLRELASALDRMPEKRLIRRELIAADGSVCALGAVAQKRGVDVSDIDAYDPKTVAKRLGIALSMTAEIEYLNDDFIFAEETPERRWKRMRRWVEENLVT